MMRMTTPFDAGLLRSLLLLLVTLCLVAPADAQKAKRIRPNDPSTDPYTEGGDPEVMAAAGICSLGGFEFATTDTHEVDDYMAVSDIRWVETEHFELGFALGPYKVTQKEKKKLLPELERLAEKLPAAKAQKKVLDPWLRAHLFAQRLEELYADFLSLIRMEKVTFPDGTNPWNRRGRYLGEGPNLGQKGKYEVLILPSEAASVSFLNHYFGLTVKKSQRWNVVERDSITVCIHTQQGLLKTDTALHGHLAFNVAINLYDGLRHYSYDTPVWLREGLAHYMERRISPDFNTFDGSEGSMAEMTRKSDWESEVRKLIIGGDQPRMAELVRIDGYGELKLPHHYAVWSIVDYLHRTNPEGFALFLQNLKGRTNTSGFADGSDLKDAHRDLFKEHLGMSYAEFDGAWADWVRANY